MSKNLTRKGLALGALVGLVSTAVAGTPAFAADELNFALSSGTVYAAPVDDTLTLNASLVSSVPAANIAQLKFKLVTDGTFTAKAVITSGSATAQAAKYTNAATGTTTTGVGTGTMAAAVTSTVLTPATTPSATFANTIAVSIDAVPDTVVADGVAPSATTATKSVTVTAWIDSNNDGVVDSGEFQKAQTLSFKKYSEITADYTWTAPSAGATSVAAKATLTNINQNQLNKSVFLAFTQQGTALTTTAALTAASGVYSGTATATASTVTAGDVFTVQAMLGTNTTSIATSTSTATATARTIDAISTAVVAGDNSLANGNVRDGGEFTIRAKVTSETKAVAGVPATATFTTTNATLGDAVYVTINGTAYKTAAALTAASVAVTSDASGYLDLTVKTTGFTAGSSTLVATFAVQNFSAGNSATASVVATKYTAVDVNDTANVGVRRLASSATTTVVYQVIDQYGVVAANDTFRTVLTGASASYQPVVGGKSTFTVTGGSADQAYTVALQKWDATTASYVAYNPTTGATGTTAAAEDGFTASYAAAANVATPGSLTLGTSITADGNIFAYAGSYTALGANDPAAAASTSAVTKLVLSDKAFAAVDTRLDKKTTAPTLAAGYDWASPTTTAAGSAAGKAAVTLTVTPKGSDVAATAIAATVTVSGKGLMFVSNGVYALDSITLIAASTGTAVQVYSHTAGANVVTVTAGTVTKTVTLTYAAVAAEAATVEYSNLPAQAQSGRALDLAAVVKDQWGNPVAGASVAFNNTGVGYVQSTSAVTSDANGKVTGRLIVLQNDLGTSYLSATLDLATDVVVAKSIEFGLTDADVVAGGRRVFVNAEFALGRTITVTVDGKRIYSKVQTTDNAVELAFTQKKKGSHTVTVRVSGGIIFTEKVTTN